MHFVADFPSSVKYSSSFFFFLPTIFFSLLFLNMSASLNPLLTYLGEGQLKCGLSLTLIPSDTRMAGHEVTRHDDFHEMGIAPRQTLLSAFSVITSQIMTVNANFIFFTNPPAGWSESKKNGIKLCLTSQIKLRTVLLNVNSLYHK